MSRAVRSVQWWRNNWRNPLASCKPPGKSYLTMGRNSHGLLWLVKLPENQENAIIWMVVDIFSKQAYFVTCLSLPSACKLAKMFLTHIYCLHGVPWRIISDWGVQFMAKFWREFLRMIGSSQGLSSAFHPATNGVAERANAMVEHYICCYTNAICDTEIF